MQAKGRKEGGRGSERESAMPASERTRAASAARELSCRYPRHRMPPCLFPFDGRRRARTAAPDGDTYGNIGRRRSTRKSQYRKCT